LLPLGTVNAGQVNAMAPALDRLVFIEEQLEKAAAGIPHDELEVTLLMTPIMAPRSAIRAVILGSASPALISLLSSFRTLRKSISKPPMPISIFY
jgi:hypothetical protein